MEATMNFSDDTLTAASHWDAQVRAERASDLGRIRWWEDPSTIRHINGLVGNAAHPSAHGAFHERIAEHFKGRSNLKAISVGCGIGAKEMWLMQMTDISRFDLFDISPGNIELGKQEAARQGIESRVNLLVADAFKVADGTDYDLVYWNNSLHHMPDVEAAVRWSHERLKPGGLFAMDDYVGPDRFQWTDENLKWASKVRGELNERFLQNPHAPGTQLPREVGRPTVEEIVATDPSEAMDSGRILTAVRRNFPSAEIIPTGGALYHIALNDTFCNFTSEDDLACLRQILLLDEMLAAHGTTHYSVAFGIKTTSPPKWKRLWPLQK
jgi:SAM-dependent methyltransferase